MHEQLKLKLFEEEKKVPEIQSLENIFSLVKPSIENILDEDFLTCPNCESNYIELSGCSNCWYWVNIKNSELEVLPELEKVNKKKAKYKTIWTIKFQIPSKKHKNILFPENRELKIDLNNLLIWENNASIFIVIKKNKYRVECLYETIDQLDENHKIDIEMAKITHNLKLKTFDINKNIEERFDFKQEILKQLKFLLTINILNNPKYNKNL